MCILLNVKKHEKTFALNVDIFKFQKQNKKVVDKSKIMYYYIQAVAESES